MVATMAHGADMQAAHAQLVGERSGKNKRGEVQVARQHAWQGVQEQ